MTKEYILSEGRRQYVKDKRKIERGMRKYFPFLFSKFKPHWIDIHRLEFSLPRLAQSFDGYRIVQFGDLHLGTWLTPERLAGVVSLINQEAGDLIVYTGDYIGYDLDRWEEALVDGLSKLRAKDGVLTVLGNHDYWLGHQRIRDIARSGGLHDVSHNVFTLRREDARLHIAGLDCAYEGMDDIDLTLEKLPSEGCAILLAHEPDTADSNAATGRFDLQLSGHSHGGQLLVPFYGPIIHVYLSKKYPAGKYNIGDMILYTNRGIGTSVMPFRINCPPEITVITLRAGYSHA